LPPFGVQLLAREYDPQVFDQLRNIGAQWVRVYLDWSRVEPVNATPDGYRWEIYDIFLAQIVKSDLIPIVTVEGNPKWAATSYRGPIDKVPLAEFAEFMKALVSRYQGPPYNVKYWELYNEPDDWEVHPWDGSRGAWGGKGAEYAEMLKVIWPAVHEADPDAKVVLGGIAYTSWSACHPCFDLDFLDDIVESGGAPYFDVLNFHYYPRLEIGKWAPPNLLGKALALRDQLPPELRDKPIMCTEVGEAYEGDPQDPPYSHELASGFLVQALVQSLAAREYGLDFLASTWFSLETYDLGSHKFGLLDPDLNPLPAYRAFQVVARELAGAEYRRRLVQPGIEGYVFSLSGGGEPVLAVRPGWPGTGKAVLWAVGEPVAYTFSGAQLRAVDKYGAESVINDGGSGDRDGTVNGSITIEITRSPTYIEWGS
jgi:hypothetical protein